MRDYYKPKILRVEGYTVYYDDGSIGLTKEARKMLRDEGVEAPKDLYEGVIVK